MRHALAYEGGLLSQGNETPAATTEVPTYTEAEKEEMNRAFYAAAFDYTKGKVDLNSLTKLHTYVMQGDGVYLIVKNRIGKFITKVQEGSYLGLEKQFGANQLVLDVPKIPSKIYYQIKQFFIDIMDKVDGAEAYAQVYYDKYEKEYVVNIPEQTVAKASVTYDKTKDLSSIDNERYIFVFEIHSHNTMGAFWSGTDDGDEKETKFYGVFGELNKETHAEKFRTMVDGKYFDLTRDHMFDFSPAQQLTSEDIKALLSEGPVDLEKLVTAAKEKYKQKNTVPSEYPKEWLEKINKPVYHAHHNYVGHGGADYAYGRHNRHNITGKNWDGGVGSESYPKSAKGNTRVVRPGKANGYGETATGFGDSGANDQEYFWEGHAQSEIEDWERYYGYGNYADDIHAMDPDTLIKRAHEQSEADKETAEVIERFDLWKVEKENVIDAIESFATSITDEYIPDLMDFLVQDPACLSAINKFINDHNHKKKKKNKN